MSACRCSLAGTTGCNLYLNKDACNSCINNPRYTPTQKVYTVYKTQSTNADCIRTMTDEELAEWIESIASCRLCIVAGGCKGETSTSKFSCKQRWLEWLQEETTSECTD